MASYSKLRNFLTDLLQFFGIFSAFSLSFWYGAKAFLQGTVNDVGTIIV